MTQLAHIRDANIEVSLPLGGGTLVPQESRGVTIEQMFVYKWDGELKSTRADFERTQYAWDYRYLAQQRIFEIGYEAQPFKEHIEKVLRDCVYPDNPFFDPVERTRDLLNSSVYVTTKPVRLLKLPEQNAEAVSKAVASDMRAFDQLCEWVISVLFTNRYSLDWRYNKMDLATPQAQAFIGAFPEQFAKLFPTTVREPDVTELDIDSHAVRYIKARFREMVTPKDIPALVSILCPNSVARLVKPEIGTFLDEYQGVVYTDRISNLDGSDQKTWVTHDLWQEWALENNKELGTVADMVREGIIQWPEPPSGWSEWATKAASLFNQSARDQLAKHAALEQIYEEVAGQKRPKGGGLLQLGFEA